MNASCNYQITHDFFFFEKRINLSNTRLVEGTYAGEKFTTKSVYGRYCWQSCLHQWCAKVTTISSFMLYIFGFWTFGRKSFRHRKTHFTCYFCTLLYHPSSGKQNVLASASNKSPHFPHEFPVLALRDFSLFKVDSFYVFFQFIVHSLIWQNWPKKFHQLIAFKEKKI